MIENLTIKNFQRHAETQIGFESGVNVIVGPTDAGKSAILRSLKWALLNQPRGGDFVRHGEKDVSVSVTVDGKSVQRSKKGSSNFYRLDEEEFTAFGSDVPSDVEQFLKVCDINFQGQHDGPYWLDLPGSEVSRRLNDLVDLQIIDKVMSASKALTVSARNSLKQAQQDLKVCQEEYQSLSWVPNAVSDWEKIEKLHERHQRLRDDVFDLSERIEDIRKVRREIESEKSRLRDMTAVGKSMKVALDLKTRVRDLQLNLDSISDLRRLLVDSEGFDSALTELAARYEKASKAKEQKSSLFRSIVEMKSLQQTVSKPVPEVSRLDDDYNELRFLVSDLRTRKNRIKSLTETIAFYRHWDQVVEENVSDLSSIEDQIASVPLCHTCGKPI